MDTVFKMGIDEAVFALLENYPEGIDITRSLDILAQDYGYLTARESVWRLIIYKQIHIRIDRTLTLVEN